MTNHYQIKKNCSGLKKGDIKNFDYKHTKRVWKDFKIKHKDTYHDLDVQSEVQRFCNKCIEIYKLENNRNRMRAIN